MGNERTQQAKHCDPRNPLNRYQHIGLSMKYCSCFCGPKRNCIGNDKEAVDCDLWMMIVKVACSCQMSPRIIPQVTVLG